MLLSRTAAFAAAFTFFATTASAVVVDFSGFNNGDIVTNFDFGGGLTGTISTGDLSNSATGEAVIFDTTLNNTADPDLESPFTNVNDGNDSRAFGNALILQEKNAATPDDAAGGGAITFTFDKLIRLTSLTILDGNDNGPTGASLFLGGAILAIVTNLGGDDNEFETYNTDVLVKSFTVDFSGSGAIGEFEAAVVPLPATLGLMGGALALLGVARRRSRKA